MVSCPTLVVPYGTVTGAGKTVGELVNVTCNTGYAFPDNTVSKLSTCQADGSWTSLPVCQGKTDADF